MAKQIDYYVEQNIDGDWRLLDYLRHNYHERPRQTITENPVFGAKLTIIDYYKGNSASGAVVKVEGHPYYPELYGQMGMAELTKLILENDIEKGVVGSVKLKFGKRGRSYFIVNA